LADIQKRGKLPIVVGGTGFYIKSLTGEIETIGIKPNWELRNNLQKDSIEELQEKLKKINWSKWQTMYQSDRQNPRRLIRAIEVSRMPILKSKLKKMEKINTLYLGLTCPFPYLYKKIDQRVEQRLNEGLENEIQKLLDLGYTWKNSAIGTTLAYFQWQDFFEKRKNKEEIIQRWKYDEHLYSRRQMTWFKKTFSQVRGEWFDISQKNWLEKVEKRFDCWYSDGSAKED
jgi:tRNA dimethylallyltransferase